MWSCVCVDVLIGYCLHTASSSYCQPHRLWGPPLRPPPRCLPQPHLLYSVLCDNPCAARTMELFLGNNRTAHTAHLPYS